MVDMMEGWLLGLGRWGNWSPIENCLVTTYHPSILHRAMVCAGSLWPVHWASHRMYLPKSLGQIKAHILGPPVIWAGLMPCCQGITFHLKSLYLVQDLTKHVKGPVDSLDGILTHHKLSSIMITHPSWDLTKSLRPCYTLVRSICAPYLGPTLSSHWFNDSI